MSLFKGQLDSGNKFTAQDDIRGLQILSPTTDCSYLGLETGDGVKWYMWFDNSDNLRRHTTAPTASTLTSGSVMYGATNDGADTILSNLGSVAINTSIQSDTDITDDLGDASYRWKDTYTQDLYFDSSNYISGSTSNKIIFEAATAIEIGIDGDGVDTKFFGATSGSFLLWDESADDLLFTDDTMAVFGDAQDFTFNWDGSGMDLDNKTANTGNLIIGSNIATDVELHGATNTSDAGWDASADTFQICDDAIFNIGGSGLNTMDGFKFWFVAADSDLYVDARTANDNIVWGSGANLDMEFHGANYDWNWSAANDAFFANDAAELCFGTSLDIYMRYEGTGDTLDIGQTSDGTGSIDIIDTPVLMTGADEAGTLLTIAGIDTTGDTDTVTIAHSGAGAGLQVTCTEADSQGIEIVGAASQTQWAMLINGAGTPSWIGANDVGMLTLKTDTAGANAGATALLVQHATAQPITAAEGFLARFVSTGTAQTNAHAVEIEVPATQPALALNGALDITGQAASNDVALTVVGNDGTNNTVAVDVHNEGTGAAVQITGDDTDSLQLKTVAKASQTTSMVIHDGQTTDWIGASDNVGMVSIIHGSTALAHAGGTMLYVASDAQMKAAAEGHCARFLSTGGARTDAHAVEISATATSGALNVSSGYVTVAEKAKLYGMDYTVYDGKATVAGATTGTIPANTSFFAADSDADAHIVILPAAVKGHHLIVYNDDAAEDFELTAAGANTINGGAAGGAITVGEGAAIFMFSVDGVDWRAFSIAAAGTLATAGQSA